MSDIGNKDVFAKNLEKYVNASGKTRGEICNELEIAYSTFSEWLNGKKYPRIDKIELLANYFGIMKSDLIEEHSNSSSAEKPKDDKITILARHLQDIPEIDREQLINTIESTIDIYLKAKGLK